MAFTKILCATDFSVGAKQATGIAIRMARETGAELVLAHAWFIPATTYTADTPFPSYVIQQVVDDARRALDEAVKDATSLGATRTTGMLLSGSPWHQIVNELERTPYDLCVVGTHGRSGVARVLLGSVAERVVRHAPCSVLTVRPGGEARPFRHVLVPTDFSESAMLAADLAGSLVTADGAVTLLHVIEVPVTVAGEIPLVELGQDLDKRAGATLENELARTRRGTNVRVHVRMRIGTAGAQTLAALDGDLTVDLVVMGSHGRTGLKRLLMGSVAEKVVRHARCPVFVARPRAEKEPS